MKHDLNNLKEFLQDKKTMATIGEYDRFIFGFLVGIFVISGLWGFWLK